MSHKQASGFQMIAFILLIKRFPMLSVQIPTESMVDFYVFGHDSQRACKNECFYVLC